MKIRMTADSTCDLTPELIRKYEIGVVPLSVVIDGEVFHDGVDVTPRDIFRAAEAGKSVRTAAVNTYEYREFFEAQLKNCDQLVHICLGSGFSTCYSDAMEASRNMENVFVVDSRNLSTGSGLLVLEGAEMAEKGETFEDALKEAQRLGFAEKNPEADVEGYDACRKIAILSSLICGRTVRYEDIPCYIHGNLSGRGSGRRLVRSASGRPCPDFPFFV